MNTALKLAEGTDTVREILPKRRLADGNGHIVAVNDNSAPSRGTGYGYDTSGDLTGFTDAAGAVTSYSYTPPGGSLAPGLLTRIFPPSLPPGTALVTNSYDSLGRVATQANAANAPGNNTTWSFRFAGYRSEEDDAYGVQHVLYLNPRGKTLFDIQDAAGLDRVTVNAYDGLDRLGTTTAPEGDRVGFTYDAAVNPWANNIATVTRTAKPGSVLAPLVQSFTYDPLWNKPATATDPLGLVTANTYAPATGTLSQTVADWGAAPHFNASRGFTYDGLGRVVTATDPLGVVTRSGYDTNGNLTSVVADWGGGSHLNQTTGFGYDSVGNVVARTDPNGNTATATWDADRRLLTQTAPPPFGALVQTGYGYDADGPSVTRANQGLSVSASST